jgi:hypothetical protein
MIWLPNDLGKKLGQPHDMKTTQSKQFARTNVLNHGPKCSETEPENNR